MKRFNLTKTLLTGALVALLGVGIQSCKKDDDPDRDKFLGTYSVSSGTITCGVTGNGTVTAGTAVVMTENSAGDEKVTMSVAGQFTLTCTVSGSNLTVDNQTLAGYTYTGTGSVNGNTLTVSLNEYDVTVPETCVYNVTATK